jgi:roadblock/LC7 domain-containing protein
MTAAGEQIAKGVDMNRITVTRKAGIFFLGLLVFFVAPFATWASGDSASGGKAVTHLRRLTIPFVENQGQLTDGVAFYTALPGSSVFVTPGGTIGYVLSRKTELAEKSRGMSLVLTEKVMGSRSSSVSGKDPVGTRINYFKGNDPSKWRRGIPAYSVLSLGETVKGVETRLRIRGNAVEKLFVVAPGADPRAISLAVAGAQETRLRENGDLELETALGPVVFTKPVAYQVVDGTRVFVPAAYMLPLHEDGGRPGTASAGEESAPGTALHLYSFALGPYDTSRELIVDPLLGSTYLGGQEDENAYAAAVDQAGNLYVGGFTWSSDFPVTPGTYQQTRSGSADAFIARVSSDFTTLLAATFLGGTSWDDVSGMTVLSGSGDVVVAGTTHSADFPVTPTAYQTLYGGSGDGYVARLNASLEQLIVSTYLGGNDPEFLWHMAADSSGNIFAAGHTSSLDFPTTEGAYSRVFKGPVDVYVSKLKGDLTELLASTYLAGSEIDYAYAVTVDGSGNPSVAGETYSPDFPTTAGAYQKVFKGECKAFVSKLKSDLTQLLASTYLGGSVCELVNALTADSFGNICAAGETYSPDFPTTPGAYSRTYKWGDAFVSRLSSDLTQLLSSTFLGGSSFDRALSIARGANDNLYISGETYSSNFPTTASAYDRKFGGGSDVFVSKLNNTLSQLMASTYLGGAGVDAGSAVVVDPGGDVSVAGWTSSVNFPVSAGAYQPVYGSGNWDAFAARFDADLSFDRSEVTLGVEKSGPGMGTVTSSPYGIVCGEECSAAFASGSAIELTAVAGEDSVFAGWAGGTCTGTGTCTMVITEDATITATFLKKTTKRYSLNISLQKTLGGSGVVTSADGRIVCGNLCRTDYYEGSQVVLTATPKDGSFFAGWSPEGICTGGQTCTVTVNEATRLKAMFSGFLKLSVDKILRNKGAGAITSSDGQIDCGTECTGDYKKGMPATLKATPDPLSVFIEWKSCPSAVGDTCNVIVDRSKSVKAVFVGPYILNVTKFSRAGGSGTVTSTPGGISCGSDCSETFAYGTVVALTATPDAGSSVVSWGGCSSWSGERCNVLVDRARQVRVTFGK